MRKNTTVVLAATLGMLTVMAAGAGDGKTRPGTSGSTNRVPTMIVDPADATSPRDTGAVSDVWIGVRLTPVPDSLSAHLGRTGLMVANVVSGSPADTAGVERYDVVTSFNGTPVAAMQDLVGAIAQLGAGAAGDMTVIRGGKERTLRITPEQRPDDYSVSYKYDEPSPADVSPGAQYFGHTFKRDPSGNWILEPLGRMFALPDDVKNSLNDLSNPAWRQWQDAFKGFSADPFRFRIQPDRDDPDSFLFFYPDGNDENANVEISITATEGGRTIAVKRHADGGVTIERTEADGTRSEASYESLDELRDADPDAYRTYRRFSGYRSRPMITLPPDLKNLGPMQRDFQEKVQRAIEKAREQAERALQDVGRVRDQIRSHTGVKTFVGRDGASSESVSLSVEDGRVRLSITRNGDTQSYEFDSIDEFRTSEPELFKQYESLLRGAP